MSRRSAEFIRVNAAVARIAVVIAVLAVFTVQMGFAAEVKLAWAANNEPDVAGYKVYYGSGSRQYSSSVDVGNQTSYTISGLEDSKPYYFAVTAYDSAGNESDYSNEVSTGVSDTSSSAAQPSSGGGGCFIATAAYGSYLAPEVEILRNFRDRWLMTNWAGKRFVQFYYSTSPPVAAFIAKNEYLRLLIRWYITPIVYAIKYPKALIVIVVTVFYLLVLYVRLTGLCRRRLSS
ncbi:MAG: CFI-box-CTERM domain-containing protein [Syntrophales bacterium]